MKPEPGLHKQVSSIFDGVRIPGRETGSAATPHGASAPSPSGSAAASPVHTPATPQPSATPPLTGGSGAPAYRAAPRIPTATTVKPGTQKASVPADTGIAPAANAQSTPQPTATAPSQDAPVSPQKDKLPLATPTRTGIRFDRKKKASTPLGRLRAWLTAGMDDPEVARQKKMKVLVGVLCIALGGVLFFSLRSPTPGQAKSAEADAAAPVMAAKITWERPAPLPTDLRDPMVMGAASVSGPDSEAPLEPVDTSRFVVTGIVKGDKGYLALVSGRVVTEGDRVFEARVVTIHPHGVEFESDGQQWVQPLR